MTKKLQTGTFQPRVSRFPETQVFFLFGLIRKFSILRYFLFFSPIYLIITSIQRLRGRQIFLGAHNVFSNRKFFIYFFSELQHLARNRCRPQSSSIVTQTSWTSIGNRRINNITQLLQNSKNHYIKSRLLNSAFTSCSRGQRRRL